MAARSGALAAVLAGVAAGIVVAGGRVEAAVPTFGAEGGASAGFRAAAERADPAPASASWAFCEVGP
ncbi:MAG: hypothetical protein JO168_14555 [Solirubrobacterales bacterium]|nr:hypothetical protein [Solirubrobacterales bacterium]